MACFFLIKIFILEKEEAKFVAWRLLNVNAAAKLLIEDYKGTFKYYCIFFV